MPDDSRVTLEYSSGHERLRLEAWGEDSIRVRAGQAHIEEDLPGALITPRPAPSAGASRDGTTLINGKLRAQISADGLVTQRLNSTEGEVREPVWGPFAP